MRLIILFVNVVIRCDIKATLSIIQLSILSKEIVRYSQSKFQKILNKIGIGMLCCPRNSRNVLRHK